MEDKEDKFLLGLVIYLLILVFIITMPLPLLLAMKSGNIVLWAYVGIIPCNIGLLIGLKRLYGDWRK